ncbi:methuselah-like protein MTH-2 [Aphelenchoides avenae]|nr:methuselah-like protein MTH-2 [Aphelenchus avenae]
MEFVIITITKPYVVFGFSFVVPTLIAVITRVVSPSFFDRKDYFCWIRPTYVAHAVAVPLTVLILNALVCMVIILLRLFPGIWGRLGTIARGSSRTLTVGKRKSQTEKIIALFFIQCTLGLPWILQYLTLFEPKVTAWHVLFTLVNGSQGMLLLALYLYKRYQTVRADYDVADKSPRGVQQHPTNRSERTYPSNPRKSID